jgi:hypothetical protein
MGHLLSKALPHSPNIEKPILPPFVQMSWKYVKNVDVKDVISAYYS